VRAQNQAFYEFLVPLIKGLSTEMSLDVASLGVQVHGGMGFIEETGAAQYLRDAKILTIYEGTTAIQANDLVGRKTARDGGQTARGIAAQIEATEARWPRAAAARARPWPSAWARRRRPSSTRWTSSPAVRRIQPQRHLRRQRALPDAGRHHLVAGWQMARALLVAEDRLADGVDAEFMRAKIATCHFYADHILNKAPGLRDSIVDGPMPSPPWPWSRSDESSAPRAEEPAAAHHRLAAVHHQQPQAGDRAVQGRRGRLHAGAERAPGVAARRVAGRDHRGWRPGTATTPTSRPRPLPSTRSCTRATTGSSTTCRCAPSTRCPSSSPRWARAPTSTTPCTAWGGVVLHDIINNAFAHKAIEKGADGLIAVAAGAGGHAGVKSPFALVQEIREWFDGPLALSGPSPPVAPCWPRRPWAPTSPTSGRPSSPPRRRARSTPTSSASSTATATTSSTATCSPACTATT
jgi:NAD(P)H-dependent flavin oxidoreductase YrpB (nitropropane dioxygenase family)